MYLQSIDNKILYFFRNKHFRSGIPESADTDFLGQIVSEGLGPLTAILSQLTFTKIS